MRYQLRYSRNKQSIAHAENPVNERKHKKMAACVVYLSDCTSNNFPLVGTLTQNERMTSGKYLRYDDLYMLIGIEAHHCAVMQHGPLCRKRRFLASFVCLADTAPDVAQMLLIWNITSKTCL